MPLDASVILRHAAQPVPRYTSYPTAPHFGPGVDGATYGRWLAELPENSRISLYLHIPFCDSLCWFCGCSTKITRHYAPIANYLLALKAEISRVAPLLPRASRITHIHWGGGSPTILSAADMGALMDHISVNFRVDAAAEFAVEVDPRGMDVDRIDALAAAGLTRVSVGVQDFDPVVQKAINRVQSFSETKAVVDRFRSNGVSSLNIDAIYGLPGQGATELRATLGQVVDLGPDRVAVFGYAHVPWMKRHQALIAENMLAGAVDRHAHAELAAEILVKAGYERVGIDHFAKPDDALAIAARNGHLQRNFQGYTVDPAEVLIGLGASAIGRLPQGYVQNDAAIGRYMRKLGQGDWAIEKGRALTDEDRIRGHVIERLMCDLAFDGKALRQAFGTAAEPLMVDAAHLVAGDRDGFVQATDHGFAVTEKGRAFVRVLAAQFDAYLPQRIGGHSVAV